MKVNDFYKTLKGHFHLDVLDKNDKVLDTFDEHNMIMADARKSMAEIFANLVGIKFAHQFIIGTMGHTDASLYIPKDEYSGFVKERDRLFSEPTARVHSVGDQLENIRMYDVIAIYEGKGVSYYRYNGNPAENYILSDAKLVTDEFTKLPGKPYYYTINFTLPRTNIEDPSHNNNADETSLDTIKVEQKDTSVIFTFTLDLESANKQYVNDPMYSDPCSFFNEACIKVNDRIFCMKTFNTKCKDDSVKFRIIWTITF